MPYCSSFWLSSSSSTAALYWPLLFGVAVLNPPFWLGLVLPFALGYAFEPGYAENEGPPADRFSDDAGGV